MKNRQPEHSGARQAALALARATILLGLVACASTERRGATDDVSADPADRVTIKVSSTIGWSQGQTPTAPPGFSVTRYADDLVNPRWVYVAPNGDVLVAESSKPRLGFFGRLFARFSRHAKSQGIDRSADRITLLRDTNGDGAPDVRTRFLKGLHSPIGMLVLGDAFYVANTDNVTRYPYRAGQTQIEGEGQRIIELPGAGYDSHWTRNLIASADGRKLYISVGSASNNARRGMEDERRRANILQTDLDGGNERIYASGLRNPLAMGIEPSTGALYTAVAEREGRGDDRVPDFFTRVRDGGFYGWPYAYFGQHIDPKLKYQDPELVARSITPDVSLGAHVSPLSLAFYRGQSFPAAYRGGVFISERGSWNRSTFSGYRVVFMPFANGRPAGPERDFLTGFIADASRSEVHGRPVGVAVAADGALLLADDSGNMVWRIQATQ